MLQNAETWEDLFVKAIKFIKITFKSNVLTNRCQVSSDFEISNIVLKKRGRRLRRSFSFLVFFAICFFFCFFLLGVFFFFFFLGFFFDFLSHFFGFFFFLHLVGLFFGFFVFSLRFVVMVNKNSSDSLNPPSPPPFRMETMVSFCSRMKTIQNL